MPSIGKAHIYGPVSEVLFEKNSAYNQDGILESLIYLKSALKAFNIELTTSPDEDKVDFDLYIDCYPEDLSDRPSFLLALECPTFTPRIYDPTYTALFSKVFSWNQELKSLPNYVNITLPSYLTPEPVVPFRDRTIFSCLINANKISPTTGPNDLYQEREKIIRWYEKNSLKEFHLYGRGWDKPRPAKNTVDKIFRRGYGRLKTKIFSQSPYPSYRGEIDKKGTILSKAKFCFSYENIYGIEDYITEKIFDAMRNGAIPIYLGAPNIGDYIPEDCFIDARNFKSTFALNKFIHSITEKEFSLYQKKGHSFLQSQNAYHFSPEKFSATVSNQINSYLKNQ